MTTINDVNKISSELNNTANLSHEYHSTSNVVQLEGKLLGTLYNYLTYSTAVICAVKRVLLSSSLSSGKTDYYCKRIRPKRGLMKARSVNYFGTSLGAGRVAGWEGESAVSYRGSTFIKITQTFKKNKKNCL